MKLLDRILFALLLLLLLLTPLPYATVETWSVTLWELLIFFGALLWGVKVLLEGRLTLSNNLLTLPLVGLLIVAVIQLWLPGSGRPSFSYDRQATFQAVIKLLAFILFFLLFATTVNTAKRRELIVNTMIGLAFIIALIGIGQSYVGKALWQRGTFGPFVNRNHFAGFLEMGLGLVGGLLVGRSLKRDKLPVYLCIAIVLLAGLIVSASRGGMVSCVASTIFLAVFASGTSEDTERRRLPKFVRTIATTVLFTGLVAGVMLFVGAEDLLENFSRISLKTGTEVWVSESLPVSDQFRRRDIWQATIQLIKDHPVLGIGLGAYPLAYTRYDPSSGLMRVEQAHNDYLQILADAGIIGGALALAFIVLLFARGLAAARTRDRQQRAIVIGALAGCFAIAIHSFVDFNLQVTANAQLFLALAALATTLRSELRESSGQV